MKIGIMRLLKAVLAGVWFFVAIVLGWLFRFLWSDSSFSKQDKKNSKIKSDKGGGFGGFGGGRSGGGGASGGW